MDLRKRSPFFSSNSDFELRIAAPFANGKIVEFLFHRQIDHFRGTFTFMGKWLHHSRFKIWGKKGGPFSSIQPLTVFSFSRVYQFTIILLSKWKGMSIYPLSKYLSHLHGEKCFDHGRNRCFTVGRHSFCVLLLKKEGFVIYLVLITLPPPQTVGPTMHISHTSRISS